MAQGHEADLHARGFILGRLCEVRRLLPLHYQACRVDGFNYLFRCMPEIKSIVSPCGWIYKESIEMGEKLANVFNASAPRMTLDDLFVRMCLMRNAMMLQWLSLEREKK